MKGKKGKKGGKGKEGPWDEERFERDLLRAIEESKRSAGLVDPLEDYVPANADALIAERNAEERKEEEERRAAQEEQMKHMQNIDLEVSVDCAVCMLVIVRPT